MLNLQLYIYNDDTEGYDQVELFQDESITITQSIQDVKDIQKVFTDYSRSFSVPASKQNNKVFKHFYNYHIAGFDAQTKIKAQLFLNHKFYKSGYIKLESASTFDNKAHTYKVTFYGSGLVLKEILQDDLLEGLALLNDQFSFDYSSANIISYLQSGLDANYNNNSPDLNIEGKAAGTIEDAIIVPLMTHTKRLVYDSGGTVNSDTINNLHNDTNKGLDVRQLKPAIKIIAILRAIEAQYGDQGIKFSDDFFNEDNPAINSLYMWLHTKSGELFTDQNEKVPVTGFLQNPVDSNGGSKTGCGKVHDNYYETPLSSLNTNRRNKPRFCNITIDTPDNEEFTFIVKSSDGNILTKGIRTPQNNKVTVSEFYMPKGMYSFFIEGASVGTYTVNIRVHRSTTTKGFGIGLGVSERFDKFIGTAVVGSTRRLNAAEQMPKMKVLDFLTGLFKMFNLTSFVNQEGVIVVQTLDQFFETSADVYDVTEYVDKNKAVVQNTIPFKKVEFKYKGLDGFLADNHEEQFGYGWGSVNTDDVDIKQVNTKGFSGQEYIGEIPFEHFKYEKLYNSNDDSDTKILWGWSVDNKKSAFIGNPLLFYAASQAADVDIRYINIDNSTATISSGTKIYMPSNSRELDVDDSLNLHFNSEQNEWKEIPFHKTLFQEYYKNYITEIFDKHRRITNIEAYLPLSVLMNINLNDTLKVFDNIFRINSLTTNYQTLRSNLELVNTTTVAGKLIETDIKLNPASLGAFCATSDSDTTNASNTVLKADCSTLANDGILIVNNGNQFDADSNTPDTADAEGNPVIVTPATIFDAHVTADSLLIKADSDKQKADQDLREVTSSSWRMGYQISELGKIDNSFNLDQYGFLFSTTQSDVEGTDVDDIAAVSSVTDIKYETQSNNKRPATPFNASYQETNATSATTYYVRFYARTNTGLNYAEADVISEIETITTT